MPLSERDKERINLMSPVASDLKLGDKLAELERNSGGVVDAYTKSEADTRFQAKGNYALKTEFDALVARVEALENSAGGGS